MQPQVICLGAVNLDLKYEVEDLPGFLREWGGDLRQGGEAALAPEDEPRLNNLLTRFGHLTGRFGGGMAANVACALARMGLPVALVGRVGADADGEFLQESLRGVDLSHLRRAGASGRAYILVDGKGERSILVAPNTNDELTEADIPWEQLGAVAFLHLTSFAGAGPLGVQRAIARRLPDTVRLSLDPGELYARQGWAAIEEILDPLETLLVTETEWRLLGGDPAVHPNWGPPLVLIKRGAKGARLLTPLRHLDFPVLPARGLVDTVGAGDVFAAGYLAGRVLGLPLNATVRLANLAAGQSLTREGREGYPDRQWLEKQLPELQKV